MDYINTEEDYYKKLKHNPKQRSDLTRDRQNNINAYLFTPETTNTRVIETYASDSKQELKQ